jgi:hypothetical protein
MGLEGSKFGAFFSGLCFPFRGDNGVRSKLLTMFDETFERTRAPALAG